MNTTYMPEEKKFQIKKLDYEFLEGFLSKETLDYHYGKHHVGYVNKLNTIISSENFQDIEKNIQEIDILSLVRFTNNEIKEKRSSELVQSIFNNAAQILNHDFFWCGLTNKSINISDNLKKMIEKNFKSIESFTEQFTNKAMNHFGSGWCWLVMIDDILSIECTKDAYNPLLEKKLPLFVCDLWEHSYYIDYRNNRADYLKNMWQFVNWEFIEFNTLNLKKI